MMVGGAETESLHSHAWLVNLTKDTNITKLTVKVNFNKASFGN